MCIRYKLTRTHKYNQNARLYLHKQTRQQTHTQTHKKCVSVWDIGTIYTCTNTRTHAHSHIIPCHRRPFRPLSSSSFCPIAMRTETLWWVWSVFIRNQPCHSLNGSCHTDEWVIPHIMIESSHTNEWVILHAVVWITHTWITQNESCYRVMAHV